MANYEKKANMYVEAVRAATEAAREDVNANSSGSLKFPDPIEFWVRQVIKLLCAKISFLGYVELLEEVHF